MIISFRLSMLIKIIYIKTTFHCGKLTEGWRKCMDSENARSHSCAMATER